MTSLQNPWRDATSYSQSEPRPRVPRTWARGAWPHEIKVHRRHGAEVWFVSCVALGIEGRELRATNIEEAKVEACDVIRHALAGLVAKMRAALGDDA